eukprot:TRINITY_DN3481_c0_g2_i2.p1 TRINITY_DN3481_c0_g2~~TRINITY_DN3481_c0_g2_i2.p1  ORF type:complete len:1509 (+),score=531.31 TRINITY_DN3481_c0_g2_i2:2688-7214(+)
MVNDMKEAYFPLEKISASQSSIEVAVRPWLNIIAKTLFSALEVVQMIHAGETVVIQEGTDSNCGILLTSLAQLLLDPYYRTLEGFGVLIEKEWCTFGFPFASRLGHGLSNKKYLESFCPTFLLFLDCTWQIWRQFPKNFEFNEHFLSFMANTSFSCLFGTFLTNSEKEKKAFAVKNRTFSVWQYVHQHSSQFHNPFYVKESALVDPILPAYETQNLLLWNLEYLRWNSVIASYKGSISNSILQTQISGSKELSLVARGLIELPAETKDLNGIWTLNLARNQFNTIPAHVMTLSSLRSLNLSGNHIGIISPQLFELMSSKLVGLTDLNLSSNHIFKIPKTIAQFQNLEVLDLSCNYISALPEQLSGLISLRVLSIVDNRLCNFPNIKDFPSLEVLNISKNSIAVLPEDLNLSQLKKLTMKRNGLNGIPESIRMGSMEDLDLSHNKLNTITSDFVLKIAPTIKFLELRRNNLSKLPSEISQMKHLVHLDLKRNALTEFKYELLQLTELKSLDLSLNHLVKIPNELYRYTKLEQLRLSKNQLESIPPSIGQIETLIVLELDGNQLEDLPPTISLLTQLVKLDYSGNKLSLLPRAMIEGGQQAMFGYLKDLLKGFEKQFRTRILVVGQHSVGKSTLCNTLRKKGTNAKESGAAAFASSSRDLSEGLHIESWPLSITMDTDSTKSKKDVDLSVWDFEGEDISYADHQFFMAKRSVFIIVWNLISDPEKGKLDFWLHSIKTRVKSAPVFIVGTHLDHPSVSTEGVSYLIKKLQKKFEGLFPSLTFYFRTVSSLNGEGIKKLRQDIEEAVVAQKHMGENIPTSFRLLETQIQEEAKRRNPPILTKSELFHFGTSSNITEERELARATKILHEMGTLVHFETDPRLVDIVVLSPKWLTELMSMVLSTKHNHVKNGILHHSALKNMWKPPHFPESHYKIMLSLLENFEIAFGVVGKEEDFNNGTTIVPSLLPESEPKVLKEIWQEKPKLGYKQLSRYYKFDFIPIGLFGRLIVKLLGISSSQHYWRSGIVFNYGTSQVLIRVYNAKNAIEMAARVPDYNLTMPRDVVETVETLIKQYYKVSLQINVPCVHCVDERFDDPTLFPLDECQTSAVTGKQYINCVRNESSTPVRLDRLVPDLTMKDFNGCKIAWEQLEVKEMLGEGGAATVYKGLWEGEEVAIKKLRLANPEHRATEEALGEEDDTFSKVFTEFRREVFIMSGLEHMNLVRLKGLCLDPLCIVTEFMAHGDLYGFIHDTSKELNWILRYKMASDIASGMMFLHSAKPPIVHRDLKSPNVLLASLDYKAPVVAKVSDFGLSGAMSTVSSGEVANPRWLAPEIMNFQEFTEAADVYSYGVILWELLTRQDYFAEIAFNSQIEESVRAGKRPLIPSDCPPLYSSLIQMCWAQDPKDRPTFKDIKPLLSNLKKQLRDLFPDVDAFFEDSFMILQKKEEDTKQELKEDFKEETTKKSMKSPSTKRRKPKEPMTAFSLLQNIAQQSGGKGNPNAPTMGRQRTMSTSN